MEKSRLIEMGQKSLLSQLQHNLSDCFLNCIQQPCILPILYFRSTLSCFKLPSSLRTFYAKSQSFVKSIGPVSPLNSRVYGQKNSTLKNPRIRREHHTYVPTSLTPKPAEATKTQSSLRCSSFRILQSNFVPLTYPPTLKSSRANKKIQHKFLSKHKFSSAAPAEFLHSKNLDYKNFDPARPTLTLYSKLFEY